MAKQKYGRTTTGKPITEELVETLAAKGEQGLDPEEILRRRGGRPTMGSSAAPVESVRLDPELSEALRERVEHEGRTNSELIRDALDQDGSPVIIEFKQTSSQNVMTQGLFYLDWLLDHRGDFELAVRKALGDDAAIVWDAPRLILLAGSHNRYDRYAVNRIDERIELWTYTLYGHSELLVVERVETEEGGPTGAQQSSTPKPKPVGRGKRPPRPTYDLGHHTATMSETMIELFELLREQILGLGEDVTERFMNQYIGYRKIKNFCEIVGQRKKLIVFIDGAVDDPEGIAEDVSDIGHWGTGNRRVLIAKEQDVSRAMLIIEQAYKVQA